MIFNWITKAFNAMVAGMQKGFSNLAKYSAPLANSFQFLKNSLVTLGNAFAAAFAPIVQMVIPYLNALINGIARAITYVAQFIAILGGKSTFIRAKKIQDSYNDSLNGTAAAAKRQPELWQNLTTWMCCKSRMIPAAVEVEHSRKTCSRKSLLMQE